MIVQNKFVNGILWSSISFLIIAILQLGFLSVLSRLLNPSDFGIISIANLSLNFLTYFSQIGITPAIIQKQNLSDDDVTSAFYLSLIISILVFLTSFLIAPQISIFFKMPNLTNILRILSISFIASGFSAVSIGLISKSFDFKYLTFIETISFVIGYGLIGIGMAYYGFGVWSLVGVGLSQPIIKSTLAFIRVKHTLKIPQNLNGINHFFLFGGKFSLLGFLEFMTFNIDSIVVGKFLGANLAGVYNRALVIANLPIQHPVTVINKVLFPYLSSVNDQDGKMKLGVQLTILCVGGFAFATSFGISAASSDLVKVLLGSKWYSVIPVLKLFVLAIGPSYISNAIGVNFDSAGKLNEKIIVQSISFAVICIFLYANYQKGIISIASCVVTSECIRMTLYLVVAFRVYKFSSSEILKIAIFIIAITSSVYFSIQFLSTINEISNIVLKLILEIFAGVISVVISTYCYLLFIKPISAVIWLINKFPKVTNFIKN